MIGAAGSAAYQKGPSEVEALMRLAQLRSGQRGQDMFMQAILDQNAQPQQTAMNPPPGQASQPATPSAGMVDSAKAAGGGAPPPVPAGGGTQAGAPGAGQQFQGDPTLAMVPAPLRQLVLAIKKNNPGASNQDLFAALETAAPFMDAQQQQAMALMKQQLQVYKTEADESYKKGSLADRQKRTDAYVKHLKDLQAKGDPRAITAEGMKILAGIRQLQTRLSQINRALQSGTKPDGTPLTPDEKKQAAAAVDKLNQAIGQSQDYYRTFMQVRAGAYGQQFEQANPPPEEPDVATGGDSGGGQ